ncbi:MAG: VCBS repeat-containing protein, partial [Muribaculum sp.]|nr:VCBS repeat-containing protein [Muribaculum sp.]
LCAAALSFGATAFAQDFEPSVPLIDSYNNTSVAADFNNNGHLDIYYSGTHQTEWCFPWNYRIGGGDEAGTIMVYNNGDGTFTFDWNNPVNYEDPTFNPDSYVEGQQNNTYMHLPTHTIAPVGRGYTIALDYNNDGLLDILTFSLNDAGGWYEGWWYYWDGVGNEELGSDVASELRTPRRHEKLTLYQNLGNGRFKMVQNSGLIEDCSPNQMSNTPVAVGDYDRDGYVDIIVTGYLRGWAEQDANENFRRTRFVKLYHNNGKVAEGENQFSEVKIADVVGGTWTIEQAEGEGDDKVVIVPAQELPGEFPNICGNVQFADINNDGYLDIVISGYGTIHDEVYKNDAAITRVFAYVPETGRFKDVTTMDASQRILGFDDSPLVVADFNKDGSLDLLMAGYTWAHSAGWLSAIFLNQNNEAAYSAGPGQMPYNGDLGLPGDQGSRIYATDMDGDGNLDLIYVNKGRNIYYGTDGLSFEKESYDDVLLNKMDNAHWSNVADFNGDGVADIIIFGERTNDDNGAAINPNPNATRIFYNTMTEATAPVAPTNVKYSQADGKISITWDYDTDAAISDNLAYNVVVRYKDGSMSSILPADPETGFVKVSEGRHTALRPNVKEYTLKNSNEVEGVGVQAISLNNFTASPFTAAGNTSSGIANIEIDENAPVVYYNLQGIRIANPAKGDLVVKVQGGKAVKTVF